MPTEQKQKNWEADLDDLKKIPSSKIKITHKLKEEKKHVQDFDHVYKEIESMKKMIKFLTEQVNRQNRTIQDQEERLENEEGREGKE